MSACEKPPTLAAERWRQLVPPPVPATRGPQHRQGGGSLPPRRPPSRGTSGHHQPPSTARTMSFNVESASSIPFETVQNSTIHFESEQRDRTETTLNTSPPLPNASIQFELQDSWKGPSTAPEGEPSRTSRSSAVMDSVEWRRTPHEDSLPQPLHHNSSIEFQLEDLPAEPPRASDAERLPSREPDAVSNRRGRNAPIHPETWMDQSTRERLPDEERIPSSTMSSVRSGKPHHKEKRGKPRDPFAEEVPHCATPSTPVGGPRGMPAIAARAAAGESVAPKSRPAPAPSSAMTNAHTTARSTSKQLADPRPWRTNAKPLKPNPSTDEREDPPKRKPAAEYERPWQVAMKRVGAGEAERTVPPAAEEMWLRRLLAKAKRPEAKAALSSETQTALHVYAGGYDAPPAVRAAPPALQVLFQELQECCDTASQNTTFTALQRCMLMNERCIASSTMYNDLAERQRLQQNRELFRLRDSHIQKWRTDLTGEILVFGYRGQPPPSSSPPVRVGDALRSHTVLEFTQRSKRVRGSPEDDGLVPSKARYTEVDWEKERLCLMEEMKAWKVKRSELQHHVKRGTYIKNLHGLQPVSAHDPLERRGEGVVSTAPDPAGVDRMAELRLDLSHQEVQCREAARRLGEAEERWAKNGLLRHLQRQQAAEEREKAQTELKAAIQELEEQIQNWDLANASVNTTSEQYSVYRRRKQHATRAIQRSRKVLASLS